jgi:molecular chaperone DnaK (HSP70)
MKSRPKSERTIKVGVDFGTTRTVVAACDRGNYPVVSFVGGNGEALEHYPSILAAKGREIRAGLDALEVASDPAWQVVRSFKRAFSLSGSSEIELGEGRYTLFDALTLFLSALRHDLLERSNLPHAAKGAEISAMIAVPANAHSTQRFVTLAAFRRAGFHVVGMLNEPSAAGFEYAHRHRSTITSRRERVAVYDLGGGTFDASLVQMTGRAHDVLRARGVGRLGGDDFDELLLDHALRAARIDRGSMEPGELSRLRDHCREQKERLHPTSRRVTIEIGSEAVVVPVNEYYDACTPLIDRTIEVLSDTLPGAESEDEGNLAGIYVVGGASALPAIARALRERFGRRVHRSPYPSAAAAIGLAIAADETAGFALTDRFSRVFGVFREASAGLEASFDPIILPDAPLAVGEGAVLERTYRAAHNLGYFRYVECGAIDDRGQPKGEITPFAEVLFPFEATLRQTELDLRSIDVRRSADLGPLIRERYSIDPGGLVELTITDLDSGYERRVSLAPRA